MIGKAYLCDMLENIEREVITTGYDVELDIKPFEIVTLKITENV